MSAINEWFGYYNAVFAYIHNTYGEKELDLCLEHLAKEAYCDVIKLYQTGGLDAIRERYLGNFQKDGDETSAAAVLTEGQLTLQIHCPAFYASPPAIHPDRQVDAFFCSCCQKLNKGILRESGYSLQVEQQHVGDCRWCIVAEL